MTDERDQDVEILPPVRKPIAGGRGRVFDADGHVDRAATRRQTTSRPGGGGGAGVRAGCSLPLGRWMGRLLLVALLVVVGLELLGNSDGSTAQLVTWMRDGGLMARLAAVLAIALLTPVFVPAGIMALLPGYAWGAVEGTAIALIGAALGGLINMAIARRLLGVRIARWAGASPLLAAVKRSIDQRGFRIALALRMSPVTPYAMLSYLAGLSSLSWGRFMVASLVGGIPWTLVWASAGAAFAERSQPLALDGAPQGDAAVALRWLGLAFTVAVAWWIGRAARKELAAVRAEMARDAGLGSGPTGGAPAADARESAEVTDRSQLDVDP